MNSFDKKALIVALLYISNYRNQPVDILSSVALFSTIVILMLVGVRILKKQTN